MQSVSIIARLLINFLNNSLPAEMTLTASHIVDHLMSLNLTKSDYREKVCRALFSLQPQPQFSFTQDDLLSLLYQQLEFIHCDKTIAFSLASKIGAGTYGTIYKGSLHGSTTVAIKLNLHHDYIYLRFEAKLLSEMNHPNIVPYICMIERYDYFGFVMEYADGGTLEEFIRAQNAMVIANFSLILRFK